ncbi:MAG TPA: aldose 1-epimerase [Thermoanaerobaculia bacterium]|nr:aldose 1-epimerase [Thermoanaerobaculia bacterium]
MILDGSRRLAAGDLEAVFLPRRGMLGASLRHRGLELLRRVGDLERAAAGGSTAGIPLLHPWANRLEGPVYRTAGREIRLDPTSPLLHLDERGLPIHGVPWSRLEWDVVDTTADRLVGRLEWRGERLLSVFPFPHRLEMAATLSPGALTIETTLTAGSEGAVPVSFGFHPYLGLPGVPRPQWRLRLPAMRRLLVDARRIPSGAEEPFPAEDAPLGGRSLDDGFALAGDGGVLAISGDGRLLTVELVEGYRHAQVYAPVDQDLVALEPMTAPTNALASGRGLAIVPPGERYRAVFRVGVSAEAGTG